MPAPVVVLAMHSVSPAGVRQANGFALLLPLLAIAMPTQASAFDLFATHQVEVQFATPEGKPMVDAEVRVFAPGQPNRPYLTGHTDPNGKFSFGTDRDGFWTAEANDGTSVGRVMVRVGNPETDHKGLSPVVVLGALVVLLVVVFWYRVLRAKARRPRG